jgi:DNA invertase Pin-like site-specific DNA recombinase
MVQFAQYERRLAGQRTKDALAVKRSQGVRLGRPVSVGEAVRQRILREVAHGSNYTRIAKHLTRDGVPTGHGAAGGRATTVRKVALRSAPSTAA